MSEDPSGWALTESDPQVFTQLLRDLGVKGLQVVCRSPTFTIPTFSAVPSRSSVSTQQLR